MAVHTILHWGELADMVQMAELGDTIELDTPQQRNQNVFRVEMKNGVKQAVSIKKEQNWEELMKFYRNNPILQRNPAPKRKSVAYSPYNKYTPNGKKPKYASNASSPSAATQVENWTIFQNSNSNSNNEPHGQSGRARLRKKRRTRKHRSQRKRRA